MTKEQAIAMSDTLWWIDRHPADVVSFQLFEPLLCMPFDVFHGAVESALGRPVWTHEFATSGVEGLRKEFLKERPARTFDEVLALIPKDKQVIVLGSGDCK